jgi:aspartyl-tRNA(Asn)/glutamyl-tRNA(Gln) amidotransferase subunit B
MSWETVIGLEVHVQLKTKTKLFCACPNAFGAMPNTQTCPVCLGLPGVLPVPNQEAVSKAVLAGVALNLAVNEESRFDRKHYFYPDIPKNYQITQYDRPLCEHGWIRVEGYEKPFRIRRAHLEEDAGKLIHDQDPESSKVDLNRAGVPLVEIVSEPDFRTPDEAVAYLTELKAILKSAGVSDCEMQEGSLRCDANISLRRPGEPFGSKVEIKNLNSFKHVHKALVHEQGRQAALLEALQRVPSETRSFDAEAGTTATLRSKEEAADYRYFPEPDLPPLRLKEHGIDMVKIRASLAELPAALRERFQKDYGLKPYDVEILTRDPALARYFEACARLHPKPEAVAGWVKTEILESVNATGIPIQDFPVTPGKLAAFIIHMDKRGLNRSRQRDIFRQVVERRGDVDGVLAEVKDEGIRDAGVLEALVDAVIAEHPKVAEEYRGGKDAALSFLMGQVMRRSKGQAKGDRVSVLFQKRLR